MRHFCLIFLLAALTIAYTVVSGEIFLLMSRKRDCIVVKNAENSALSYDRATFDKLRTSRTVVNQADHRIKGLSGVSARPQR